MVTIHPFIYVVVGFGFGSGIGALMMVGAESRQNKEIEVVKTVQIVINGKETKIDVTVKCKSSDQHSVEKVINLLRSGKYEDKNDFREHLERTIAQTLSQAEVFLADEEDYRKSFMNAFRQDVD